MDLQTLFNSAETALNTYQNSSAAVATDQSKITALQTQLANDEAKQQTDGGAAYTAVGDLIAALTEAQKALPAPLTIVAGTETVTVGTLTQAPA